MPESSLRLFFLLLKASQAWFAQRSFQNSPFGGAMKGNGRAARTGVRLRMGGTAALTGRSGTGCLHRSRQGACRPTPTWPGQDQATRMASLGPQRKSRENLDGSSPAGPVPVPTRALSPRHPQALALCHTGPRMTSLWAQSESALAPHPVPVLLPSGVACVPRRDLSCAAGTLPVLCRAWGRTPSACTY